MNRDFSFFLNYFLRAIPTCRITTSSGLNILRLMVCKLLSKNIFPNYMASSKACVDQLHPGPASSWFYNFPTKAR